MLAMGVMTETGVMGDVASWVFHTLGGSVWLVGIVTGLLSSLVDTFTVAVTSISFFPVGSGSFGLNGIYWPVIAFCTAIGGTLLCVGSTSGLALMQMEHLRLGWYLRTIAPKVLAGLLAGLAILYAETLLL